MKWLVSCLLCLAACSGFAAQPRAELSGRVSSADGKPLVHATVWVYHAGVKVGYSTFCPSCYRDCGKHVTTDQNGEFKVSSLDPDLWFTLLAVHEGYVPVISEKVDPSRSSGLKIALAPRAIASGDSSIARGRVTDSAGNPVADAIVNPIGLVMEKYTTYGTVDGLDPLAVSNRNGEFELAYKGNSPAMLVEVEGRGYAPKYQRISTGNENNHVALVEGATIRGLLTTDMGKPIANAEIGLIAKNRFYEAGNPYEEQRIGTGPDGSFLLSNVPEPVTWLLYGKMDSMPKNLGTQAVEVSTTKDREFLQKVRVVAKPAHQISGKVTLSDGHVMPAGMRVILGSDSIWDSQTVTLNADGSFELHSVPDGNFCIRPAVQGYEAQSKPNSNCGVPVTVAGADRKDVVVTVYPAKSQ
jgi:hypothetical protein